MGKGGFQLVVLLGLHLEKMGGEHGWAVGEQVTHGGDMGLASPTPSGWAPHRAG